MRLYSVHVTNHELGCAQQIKEAGLIAQDIAIPALRLASASKDASPRRRR
jgi:hypothetical protein